MNIVKKSLVLVLMLVLIGCGEDPPPVNPNPAPAPETPAPVPNPQNSPTVPGGVFSGSCPPIGGQVPFNSDGSPINANLTPYDFYGSGQANNLSLNFSIQNYQSAGQQFYNVVASGIFNFPDLQTLNGGYGQTVPSAQSYTTCVASSSVNGGSVYSGAYSPVDSSVAIVLQGVIQAPQYNNYNPYNPYNPYQNTGGTPTITSQTVTVSIGSYPGCNAYISNGRLYGCVQVSYGTGYNQVSLTYIAN